MVEPVETEPVETEPVETEPVETPATAEALMRSRFDAFARGDEAYLIESWHASTRPASVDLDDGITWRALQIVDVVGGGADDDTGIVEFRASFRGPEGPGVLHERSNFVREGGLWFYLDGVAGQV